MQTPTTPATQPVNNPLTQLALLYSKIEEILRHETLTAKELNRAVERYTLTNYQVRDCLVALEKRGHLIISKPSDPRISKTYTWDVLSNPFVFGRIKQRKQQPSKPTIVATAKQAQKAPTTQQPIEFVFDGVLITIGRNPITNNIQIQIGAHHAS